MVLEYCDKGDLLKLQCSLPKMVFPLTMATKYLSQVILGLQELHHQGYLHRDIKLQNILIKTATDTINKEIIKIADFGFAKQSSQKAMTVLGTEKYMSPEIYRCGIEK